LGQAGDILAPSMLGGILERIHSDHHLFTIIKLQQIEVSRIPPRRLRLLETATDTDNVLSQSWL
jgi:hypothetical protein